MTFFPSWSRFLLVATGILIANQGWGIQDAANRFGFSGPEIFPVGNLTSHLRMADLDGDGLNDLIVVNNPRSKITLLYNQTGKTNAAPLLRVKRDINELPPGARFRIESIASEKRITALEVADLNGDDRPDIAYYGEPRELVVLYNQGGTNWSQPKTFPIDDGQLSPNALSSGDLNGDQRSDLVLLAETHVYFLPQNQDHTLGEPQRIPLSGIVKSVQVLDCDGDTRDDLLLVNWEDRNPFRFRLQTPDGQIGPEIHFAFPPIRSYWGDNLETNQRVQLMTIAQNSGRAQVSEFARKAGEPLSGAFQQGQFQVFPLARTDKALRGVIWADLNSDRLPDLLVAEPESGLVSLLTQNADGTFAAPKSFPTLAGISDLAACDWDGDGKPEIFMLSLDERQVGVARFDGKGRLPFPTLIPVEGRPLAMAIGQGEAGSAPVLALLTDQDGRRFLTCRGANGKTRTQALSDTFKSNPTTLVWHDVDQDGRADLVALAPYEKIKILRQVAGKDFQELDIAPPGGVIEQPWLAAADLDADGKAELLLTQKNFLRAVVLRQEAGSENGTNGWSFQVKEQINGAGSNSRLTGAAALPNGTNSTSSLFLLDAERKALTLCERDKSGVWQIVRSIPLPVSNFSALQPVHVGSGTNLNAVGFLGLNAVAVLPLQGDLWSISELDGFETPIKDGYLNDVVSGDLDNDGRKDLVFLETARNYLDLVIFNSEHRLVPANRWQVFEERSFRSRGPGLPEPREAVVADLTGDKKNDLVVLVHDRIILYPQE